MQNPINAIIDEQQKREVRSSAVPIVNLGSTRAGKAAAAALAGTAHVVLARKNSGVIDRIRTALDSSEDRFRQAITSINESQKVRSKPLSVDAFAKMTIKEPVFAELRCDGERMHSGLFVPGGAEAILLAYPYNGGPLPSRGLELVEYVTEEAGDQGFEAVALRCDPVLTKAEAAALKLLPRNECNRSIGTALRCETTYLWAIALLVALGTLGIALATGTCGVALTEKHLSDETIREVGPRASARSLLEMRRKALEKLTAEVVARA